LSVIGHGVVVGTSLQQNDFNKEIHKDKAYETIDNKYEDLSIEVLKHKPCEMTRTTFGPG